jgi:hypothetical protein
MKNHFQRNNEIINRIDNLSIQNSTIISLNNCIVEELNLGGLVFESMTIKGCLIKKVELSSIHFTEGLIVENNIFIECFDMPFSGHNLKKPILFCENIFNEKLNFFDCWFNEKLILQNNILLKGSNLLGNTDKSWQVRLDSGYIISGNSGILNLDFD